MGALGHALAIVAALALLAVGKVSLDPRHLRWAIAAVLVTFGVLKLVRHRHPRWVGTQVGFRDLLLWSFLMATAHGAGLMLLPLFLGEGGEAAGAAAAPSCHTAAAGLGDAGAAGYAAAVLVHTGTMLVVAGAVAFVVYYKLGSGGLAGPLWPTRADRPATATFHVPSGEPGVASAPGLREPVCSCSRPSRSGGQGRGAGPGRAGSPGEFPAGRVGHFDLPGVSGRSRVAWPTTRPHLRLERSPWPRSRRRFRMNRRMFMSLAAVGGAGLYRSRFAWPYAQSPTGLRKFIQALPGIGPTGIPAATPDTQSSPGVDQYRLSMGQFSQQLHPDLPPTKLWGYADITFGQAPNRRLHGGVIVARKNRPVSMTFTNELPSQHILPVDTTLPGAEPDQPQNRAAVHLHGGFVAWTSDGGPFAWFTPDGQTGPSFLNPGPAPGQARYVYPNDTSARLLWYHDHAIGMTRLNAHAGLASAYIVRDEIEDFLVRTGLIPEQEIPLILQDKTFVDGTDPNYSFGVEGDLWYPYLYEPDSLPTGRWAYGPGQDPPGAVTGPLPVPSVVPEFFGDTILANGAVYPFVEVKRQRYRFRILNASQARFFNLQLYYATPDGSEADLGRPGPAFVQIATEGGFLPFPVLLNRPPRQVGFDEDPNSPTFGNATRYTLLLGPAERADVIIDFSRVPAGARLVLYNDAPAPFPGGDPRNDYFTGAPDQSEAGGAPPTAPGFGPNSRTLLQFRVLASQPERSGTRLEEAARMGSAGPRILPGLEQLGDLRRVARVRDLTLTEDFDAFGRLVQRLGTNVSDRLNSQGLPTFGRDYTDEPTEVAQAGTVEIWRLFNLSMDTHPIHFHLVNVRILSRQPFDAMNFNGTPVFKGPPRGPDANELGFKETVRVNPGECLSVIMRIDLPRSTDPVPESPRTGGFEYVWHCHILEHEEHDMMRPFIVKP